MNRIKEIWAVLDKRAGHAAGLEKVRYADNSRTDLYLGIKYPECQRLFLLRTTASNPDIPDNRQFKGLKLEKIYDTSSAGNIFLSLVLTDDSFADIFDTIILDITEAILGNEPVAAVRIFADRLEKWQAVFEYFATTGLSREEQCGLYGELYFLRKLLLNTTDHSAAIKSWTGPQKSIHDFQYGLWSLEVKTTTGNNHQKIQISNERQLDTTNTEQLFLYHLSLDIRQQTGETLNALANAIASILIQDFASAGKFKTYLAEVGYFERHRHLYQQQGYTVRQEMFYKVEKEFPRIEERDIRKGVGDVNYSIIVSQFSDYTMPETEVLRKLIFNEYTGH